MARSKRITATITMPSQNYLLAVQESVLTLKTLARIQGYKVTDALSVTMVSDIHVAEDLCTVRTTAYFKEKESE